MFRCLHNEAHTFSEPGLREPPEGGAKNISCCPKCECRDYVEVGECSWCGEVLDTENNCPNGCAVRGM